MLERFAAQLREAREKKELTQEALAKLIKMDLKFLRLLESGDFTFLPELYVKAFIRAYAKAVGLSEDTALRKYALAVEGRNIDELSFAPAAPAPVAKAPAVPPVQQPVAPPPPPVPVVETPAPKTTSLPPDLFDVPEQKPVTRIATQEIPPQAPPPEVPAAPQQPVPPPQAVPVQTSIPFTPATPPVMHYPRSQTVRRYEDTPEAPPRKKRQLNAMQKRMIIFAALSLLILVIAGIAIYESSVSKSIVVENGSDESAPDQGPSRYEEPQKPVALPTSDSLVLRMEFSDLCWVSVKPDSTGESSENTFNRKSEPAEFKAAHAFTVTIGNPPGVRLLLNNKVVSYEKQGSNSIRLKITKDTAVVIPFTTAKVEPAKKNKTSKSKTR
jgi:transcriptional regulator with XRE-family HTH domain